MKRSMGMVLAAALAVFASARADDVAKGDAAKAQPIVTSICAACHGADGNSVNPTYPKLAGQGAAYIAKQLGDFKSGQRKNPIMSDIVTKIQQGDIVNLAAYFSQQTIKPGAARDKKLAEAGEKIFKGGNAATGVPACASCHGPAGAGIPTEFPHLAGQHAAYIVAQLKAFHSGTRANDGGKMMRNIAGRMGDQEMAAVAEYISGLH